MLRFLYQICVCSIVCFLPIRGEEVVISKKVTLENLKSGEEVYFGRFDLSQLEEDVNDLRVSVNYSSTAGQSVRNPASMTFDFQYWIQSEVFLVGRKDGENVFEISSGRYDVENEFFPVPPGESNLEEFSDERDFEELVNAVGQCAGEEIDLFFRVDQSFGGGTLELSTLNDYRGVEMEVAFEFSTDLDSTPSTSLEVDAQLVGPGKGRVTFMTRQGFEYHLIWAETFTTPRVVEEALGTSTDQTFTFAELGIWSQKGFFWVEEIKVTEGP